MKGNLIHHQLTPVTQAIVVPSIAFLDNLEQSSLVLFLEKLLPETRKFLPSDTADGFSKFHN